MKLLSDNGNWVEYDCDFEYDNNLKKIVGWLKDKNGNRIRKFVQEDMATIRFIDEYDINKMEEFVEELCEKHGGELEYHIDGGLFYYEMHDEYDNEIMVSFPKGSNQIYEFMEDLYDEYKKDVRYNYKEIFGDECGDSVDKLLIWWRLYL